MILEEEISFWLFVDFIHCNASLNVFFVCLRIMQDHTEGSSMHSQALETLQDRLREAETGLRREQESYHQMQVHFISLPGVTIQQ